MVSRTLANMTEVSVSFQVLTVASMKFRIVFWIVLPCKIIVDRRFIPDDGGSTYLWNFGRHSSLMMEAARTSETSVDTHPLWWRQQVPLKLRSTHIPDHGGSTYLWNVGRHSYLMMEAARTFETSVDTHTWRWRQHVSPKRRSTIILHGSTPRSLGHELWP
jgi:hypothetical protein